MLIYKHTIYNMDWDYSNSKFDQEIQSLKLKLINSPDYSSNLLNSISEIPNLPHLDEKEKIRQVLFSNSNYELVLMLWGPIAQSALHGHSGMDCYMKVLTGNILEIRYRPFTEEHLSTSTHSVGSISHIHDDNAFHRLITNEQAVATLHLYTGPLLNMQILNEDTGLWDIGISVSVLK